MKKSIALFILGSFLFPGLVYGQLPPNQPEQDCINALPVCQNVFVQPNSYQSEGLDPNEINTGLSCLLSGERNDTWYIFTTQTAGDVAFTITPVTGTDDYDWAVYNLTNNSCADIATNGALEVSCNYSGIAGPTGPNGMAGFQFEPVIPVLAGQTYVVNVSNFSGSTTGYTLDFSQSTATIFDNIPPVMQPPTSSCNSTSLEISFDENVVCATVDPTDFTVTGPGGPYTVTQVLGTVCQNGGTFEDEYTIITTPPITAQGLYTISVVDTILDNCGNVAVFNSQSLFISNATLTASAAPDNICEGDPTTLTTSLSGTPGFTFVWTPGNATSPSPTVTPLTTTTYNVVATDQAGCTYNASVTVTVKPRPSTQFSMAGQVCAGLFTNITYSGNPPAGATFQWNFGNASSVIGNGPGPYQVAWNIPGQETVTLNVIANGCAGTPFSQTIDVFEVPTAAFFGPSSVCIGDTALFTFTGSAPANANYVWTFPGAAFVQNLSSPGTQGPYKVVWNSAGPRDVCIQVDNQGCLSPLECNTVDVKPIPNASIVPVANQCFTGNSFNFTYNGDPATTFNWGFGADANPPFATGATPPTVSYQNPGVKEVYVIVSQDGCVSDTAKISFEVVPEPSADFSASTTEICSDTCITFTYVGVPQGPNQSYFWDFGAGAIPPTTTLTNPPCVDFTGAGVQDVTLTVTYKGCVVSTTQSVTVKGSPVVSAGPDIDFCEGDGGVQVNATVTGGTTPYFYSWTCSDPTNCGISNNSIEDPVFNPNSPSPPTQVTYYLTVQDVNGCQGNIDSAVLTVKPKPKMDAGPDASICEEGLGVFLQGSVAANNNAPLPISYLWVPSTGINDPTIPNPYARPTQTTIYTLVGISANGCSSDVNTLDPLTTATVTVNPLPVAEAGADTALCFGDQLQLQGFASGAGPNYNYFWTPATPGTINDPNSPTPIVTPNQTTTFTLVVESNGCFSEGDDITVIVDTKPTANAGNDQSICLRDSALLNGRADGDPDATFYTYTWSPATGLSDPTAGKPKASPSTTTTYTLTASSNFGCGSDQSTVTVTVKPTPEVEALSADTIICEGDTISLAATHTWTTAPGSPVVYTWSPENSILTSPFLPNVTVLPDQTTLYTVTTSVASNDCPTTDQVLVTVSPKVIAKAVTDTSRFCRGDAVGLTASGGLDNATFTWTPAAGLDNPNIFNPIASPDSSITYKVLVAEGACSDSAEVELNVNPTPIADYFTSLPDGCAPLTVSFLENTQGGTAFEWDFGDGSGVVNGPNPSHTYEQPGDYLVTLTVYGPGGCADSIASTTITVTDNVIADFTSDPPVDSMVVLALPNATVSFTDLSENASAWFWDFGDGKGSNDQNPVHTYSQTGEFTVKLTASDEQGCVKTIEYGPYSVVIPEVMIPNVFSPNGDGVNDGFIVQYRGSETFRIEIFDRWGKPFFNGDAADKPWNGLDLNGNPAPEGVYYYALMIGENTFTGNITLLR
jgi:gliding motility-associated-like protein